MTLITTLITTRSQLIAAHRLASTHGHAWASVVYVPTADHPQGVDDIHIDDLVGLPIEEAVERIGKASIEARPEWPGITAPTWDADGDIVHETGTGRLQWTIDQAGRVSLIVSRPQDGEGDDYCAAAVVSPGGIIGGIEPPCDSDYSPGQTCLIRHAETLTEAIAALTGRPFSDVRGELVDLYRVAVDNQRSEVASLAERLVADAERLWFRLRELADASDDPIEARDLSPEMMAWMSSAFGEAPQ